MKSKLLLALAAFAMVFGVTAGAQAQYAVTNDVIFVNLGYIPNYTASYDVSGADDLEFMGFAVMGEYNLNLGAVWIGFGLEYQYLVDDEAEGGTEDLKAHFLVPQVNAKFVTGGGLYFGAGLAGKYLVSSDYGDNDPDSAIDLWGNVMIGFFTPIAEGVYFNVEGRFGYNLTNQQWGEGETAAGAKYDVDMDSAYDIAVYVGVGFRALSTGL